MVNYNPEEGITALGADVRHFIGRTGSLPGYFYA